MKLMGSLAMSRNNLRRNIGAHLLSGAVSTIGVASLVFFMALGQGVKEKILDPMIRNLQSELEVRPGTITLGPLLLDKPALLGGGRLDDSMINKLKKIKGVRMVYPRMNIKFPVMAYGRFFKKGVSTDLVVDGVDEGLVESDLGKKDAFRWKKGKPVPVVISPHLLALYNTSFAGMHNLPRITPALLEGFRFHLVLGRSYLGGTPDPAKVDDVLCRLQGFSLHSTLIGATLPLSFVKAMNRKYAGREAAQSYSSAILELYSPAYARRVQKEAQDLGLKVTSDSKDLAEKIETAVLGTTALLSLVGFVILIVAALVTALVLSLQVSERKVELGLLRAIGATRRDITLTILFEAGTIGLFSGIFGLLLAWLASMACDSAASAVLGNLPMFPKSIFSFPAWLVLAGIGLSLFSTCIGALVPARKAAGLDPVQALS
ncbi:MAG: ABC transporter permease [Deltaproteobacteria bacterium]|nr:ABC transporter permease [Deltaproteobacteria bacterium]